MLPPLTLQMIFENIINHNTISKQQPLTIRIEAATESLVITNSVQSKINGRENLNEELENINNKLKLISNRELRVEDTVSERHIFLPLLQKTEAEVL